MTGTNDTATNAEKSAKEALERLATAAIVYGRLNTGGDPRYLVAEAEQDLLDAALGYFSCVKALRQASGLPTPR